MQQEEGLPGPRPEPGHVAQKPALINAGIPIHVSNHRVKGDEIGVNIGQQTRFSLQAPTLDFHRREKLHQARVLRRDGAGGTRILADFVT